MFAVVLHGKIMLLFAVLFGIFIMKKFVKIWKSNSVLVGKVLFYFFKILSKNLSINLFRQSYSLNIVLNVISNLELFIFIIIV